MLYVSCLFNKIFQKFKKILPLAWEKLEEFYKPDPDLPPTAKPQSINARNSSSDFAIIKLLKTSTIGTVKT